RAINLGGKVAAEVMNSDGLRITAILVKHYPANPAYGYRFDFKGRSIVISGDTAPDNDLARAAHGSDILVHEALSPELVGILHDAMIKNGHLRSAKIMHDIPGYHKSHVKAAQQAHKNEAR